MRIINSRDIMETIEMLTAENLDVRTVTMGISLLDCIDPDPDRACEKIYNKITRLAGNLVPVVNGISEEYGIPIVNKRISVTPIAMLLGAAPDADPVQYAKTLDRAAKAVGVNFIGGFGALVHKGFSAGDKRLIAAIPRALAETDIVCSSVNIGSTKSGIAPFFSDKYAKIGFQICELFDEASALEKLERVLEVKNVMLEHLYHKSTLNAREVYDAIKPALEEVRPYVTDTFHFLHKAVLEGKVILLEGQLGSMKDPDHGIYPMVTSSSPLAGFGTVGAGLPPYEIKDIVCVSKAYSSAVGAGAFVSEIFGEEAQTLRIHGGDKGEFGATTGRPRRMGWYDCVASRYGVQVQGATQVALTVVDALSYLDEIPVCVAYEVDGKIIHDFPTTPVLERCKPVWKVLPGWKQNIRGITKYEDLPEACRNYVEFIEQEIGVRITMVSNGPGREEILHR